MRGGVGSLLGGVLLLLVDVVDKLAACLVKVKAAASSEASVGKSSTLLLRHFNWRATSTSFNGAKRVPDL